MKYFSNYFAFIYCHCKWIKKMLQKKVRVANKNILPYCSKISTKYLLFNHMHNFLLRLITFLFCFLLLITDTAGAQPEMFSEEIHLLEMYYKKKNLIISATRHPKPVSQIAENITVITAKVLEKKCPYNNWSIKQGAWYFFRRL